MSALRNIRSVFIDLSGTIHIDDSVISGAVQSLERLRKSNLKIKFVTNTTKESKETLYRRLQKIGFDIGKEEIFTSLTAAKNLVQSKGCRAMLLLSDDAKSDFEGIPTENPNSVVVGLAPDSFNYDTLNQAFRVLLSGGELIAIHKARYYKRPDGLALGPGPFVACLEYATGAVPTIVGKPEKSFFTEALKTLNCSPEETVMIGDDVEGDVHGAQQLGIRGVLVQTGKYRQGDENKIIPAPSLVCKDFPAAVDHILTHWV